MTRVRATIALFLVAACSGEPDRKDPFGGTAVASTTAAPATTSDEETTSDESDEGHEGHEESTTTSEDGPKSCAEQFGPWSPGNDCGILQGSYAGRWACDDGMCSRCRYESVAGNCTESCVPHHPSTTPCE
jgi:hypothetical protein